MTTPPGRWLGAEPRVEHISAAMDTDIANDHGAEGVQTVYTLGERVSE